MKFSFALFGLCSVLTLTHCKSTEQGAGSKTKDVLTTNPDSPGSLLGSRLYFPVSYNSKEYICRLSCPGFDPKWDRKTLRRKCAESTQQRLPLMIPVSEFGDDQELVGKFMSSELSVEYKDNVVTKIDEKFSNYAGDTTDRNLFSPDTCLNNAITKAEICEAELPNDCHIGATAYREMPSNLRSAVVKMIDDCTFPASCESAFKALPYKNLFSCDPKTFERDARYFGYGSWLLCPDAPERGEFWPAKLEEMEINFDPEHFEAFVFRVYSKGCGSKVYITNYDEVQTKAGGVDSLLMWNGALFDGGRKYGSVMGLVMPPGNKVVNTSFKFKRRPIQKCTKVP